MLDPILLIVIVRLIARIRLLQHLERRDATRVVGRERGAAQALAQDFVAETGAGGVEGCAEDAALDLRRDWGLVGWVGRRGLGRGEGELVGMGGWGMYLHQVEDP